MFKSEALENKLAYSHTIQNEQAVWTEWNLNQSYNISRVGNYRYRPGTTDANYGVIRSIYEEVDPVNTGTGFKGYYTGATDSDIIINAGFDDNDEPAYFLAPKRKINLLYSLDDCFKQNRPRSGINKLLYLGITGGNAGNAQYIDSLSISKTTKSRAITTVATDTYSRNGNQLYDFYDPILYPLNQYPDYVAVPVIKYECINDFSVGDDVKVDGVVVNGNAHITISSGSASGTIIDKLNIYVGQTVTGSYFSAGTYIVSISNSTIVFSTPALTALTNQLISFSGANSDFNFSTPKNIIDVSGTQFVVETNTSEKISSGVGGIASYGYTSTSNIARRPRYYMSSRYDDFKYWTSYRTEVENEKTNEFGVSNNSGTGTVNQSYYIYDAAPFVVYKEKVATNKIVVKMQTNIGESNNGPYRIGNNSNTLDPFYGEANKTVPKRWTVQGLDSDNKWVGLISFDEDDTRRDGSAIVGSDGQVEVEYGLVIPSMYVDNFTFAGEITSMSMRPTQAPYGYAYLYKPSTLDKGILSVSDGASWNTVPLEYSWQLAETDITKNTKVLTKLSDPDYFIENSQKVFREFQFIKGLRIVVDTMNKINSTFDLIELSPRLVADITKKTIDYSVTKTLSDLGSYSMPTGNLLASTGQINIFDDDLSFNENNTFNDETNKGSIISQYSNSKIKFLFYDIVKNVDGYDYYIPVKTLYSERIPQVSDTAALISLDLRDLFYLLESKKSPELLLTNVSLSYAITVLLDYIGFSNYVFKRTDSDEELIIPYFFVGPDQNMAETLQQLAMSSQSAMFFDEFNNFVIMSKNYILPAAEERKTDLVLYGQEEIFNEGTPDEKIALPNIMNIASQEKLVYNGGEINYTTRYIQRSLGSIAQAPYIDDYKTFIYKPVLLWEVAGNEMTKTVNESASQSSGYSLSAMPIKAKISSSIPQIVDGTIINNIIDFGESVYWLGNYSGYFYANGEIIRYDAVEYSIAGVGNVWISDNQEYQSYFANLRFNGKMYPTGRVRIYVNVQGTTIKEHGRSQFGTDITEHLSGIDDTSPWIANVKGCIQNSKDYLFNTNRTISYPKDTGLEEAGNSKVINGVTYTSQEYAIKSTRNGIIKNFMANTNITENSVNYYKTAKSGSVQTSALIFNGPTLSKEINPADFLTYTYRALDKPYKNFGTRLRIIGKIESGTNQDQTPIGSFDIYSPSLLSSDDPSKQISITGGSGGIAFGLNKDTNIGYYFEIAALSQNNISSYNNNSNSSSYSIVKSPIITVVSGLVTVTLDSQHNFDVGTSIVVKGVVDDNRKSSVSCSINGEFVVSSISTDRKQFQYTLPTPVPTVANITAVTKTGSGTKWTITYTANNGFLAGQLVNITGLAPSPTYNLSNAVIATATSTAFTVIVAADPGTPTDVTGQATHVVLSTTSASGGTVSRALTRDTVISDVFFYKVVSGSNTSDIIIKERASDKKVTLTTLRDHSFIVGEEIVVTNVDAALNGKFTITGVAARTIEYYTVTSGVIAPTSLDPIGLVTGVNKIAIPEILWRGLTEVLVDDGKFTTQSRLTTGDKTTVYDLSAEYLDVGTARQFYLYLNNNQIAVVTDTEPLPVYNNMALFVRGSSRLMFENVYALSDNFAENTARSLQLPVSRIFGDELVTESEAIKKYAISGMVQNTYLSGISSENPPAYSLYYEEFGTIMREAAYFNVRYDRAFPALYAKLAETLNRVRGYSVSGFMAGSYGAEFLIFNTIDKNLNLDDTSGNYLRILGIAFTQNTTHSLKVDDFFKKNSNFTEDIYNGVSTAGGYQKLYSDVVNSRNKYGRNDFSIDTPYVQTDAAAESMMNWIIKKVIYPRKTVGISAFAVPHLQLGDIVQVNYSNDGVDIVTDENTRFVVYNIEYKKESGSVSTTIHLAEV